MQEFSLDLFFKLLSRAPQREPTDLVIPVGYFDDTTLYRTFVMFVIFVVPAQLDTKKLYDALERVVSRRGWGKLAATLEQNHRGELEHHISQSSPKGRRAITYDPVDHSDMLLAEHPAKWEVPCPPSDGQPAVVGNPDDLFELVDGAELPKTLGDYLHSGRSQFGLRTVSFKDYTIIVLHWPHLAFDAMALNCLLEAWSLALGGQDDKIAEALPPSPYPLEELGKTTSEPHILDDRRMSLFGIASWLLRNIYHLASPKEHRMVCVPNRFLKELKKKAEEELENLDYGTAAKKAEESLSNNGMTANIPVKKPFLSKGDVLVAWLIRLFLLNSSEDSKRLVCVQQAYDSRSVLDHLLPPQKPFLGNCVGFLVTLLPISDVLTKPLGYLASAIRRSITEQRTREQAEAYSSLVRQNHYTRSPPFFGNGSTPLYMFSNWQKANIYGFDLSGAAIHERNEPLLPCYVQTVQKPYNFPDGIIILGEDEEENVWFSGHKRKGEWTALEKYMKGVCPKHEIHPRSAPPDYGTAVEAIGQTFAVVGMAVATWYLGRFFPWN
ncbi:hypothetical protein LX36DRAFT_617532 [Colletotrichum falcatum]|nr:hypothetical protein LX36DRAFT_617532 [Colletotrichum falcatum]